VTVTASRRLEESELAAVVRSFLSVRRAWFVLAAAVVLAALTLWRGASTAPVPTAVEMGRATIPVWRLLAMGAAVLPVLALHSRLADQEAVATRRLRRFQRLYLGGMSLACLMIYLGISAIALHPYVLMIMARSWLAWLGLALVAGAVLGWQLAWTLPAFTAAVLTYWGYRRGGGYEWWEFSARPHDDLPSLLVSLALFATGLVAYWLTPWRRRRLAYWRRATPTSGCS
jgi:hypothetical protein